MNIELIKLIGKLKYRSSFGQNALEHSIEVAYFASTIAGELGGDMQLARRAGILHDIGKALTNDREGSHVDLGAEVCRKYNECAVVINSIYAHHDLEEALSIECASVCAGDVLSAARPGARKDIAEIFTSRLESIENIAYKRTGVLRAYAIDAGRELRIIVNAKLINDAQTFLVAKDIAEQIEKDVQYPGKIKVSVIREVRSIKYAL
jgi:ribonuclease Y